MSKKELETDPQSFPRPGSELYSLICGSPERQKLALKRWRRLNKYFIIPFYRIGLLPLTGLSFVFLLLFTKGRKTGKQRITPLEYHRKDGIIHIFAARGKKAHWFKNMLAYPDDLKVRIGYRKFPVQFEILEFDEKVEIFRWYVRKLPRAGKFLFGWNPKKDDPETADFTSLAEPIQVMRLHPKPRK